VSVSPIPTMSMNGVAMSDVPKPVAPPMTEATATHRTASPISSTSLRLRCRADVAVFPPALFLLVAGGGEVVVVELEAGHVLEIDHGLVGALVAGLRDHPATVDERVRVVVEGAAEDVRVEGRHDHTIL